MEGYNCLNRDSTYLILDNHSARVIFRLNFALKHNSTLTSEEEIDEDGLWVSWGRLQEGGRSCRSRLISSMSDIPSVEL